jgi:hypothetical protein
MASINPDDQNPRPLDMNVTRDSSMSTIAPLTQDNEEQPLEHHIACHNKSVPYTFQIIFPSYATAANVQLATYTCNY